MSILLETEKVAGWCFGLVPYLLFKGLPEAQEKRQLKGI